MQPYPIHLIEKRNRKPIDDPLYIDSCSNYPGLINKTQRNDSC